MKTLLLFTDTETTGLLFDYDQVISYALLLQEKEKSVLEEEVLVKLKNNVFPNPKALLVNNLNPFSKEFKERELSQFDAAMYFRDTLQKYRDIGYRIVLIAYNAEFDIEMYKNMLSECGVNFDSLIDFSYDPLITAKKLIESGVLETREVQIGFNKTYKSSRLEDVYNALGYSSKDITAHNALDDSRMLRTACSKLLLLYTGKSSEEVDVSFEDLSSGDIKKYVYSDGLDLIFKTVLIVDSNRTHIKVIEYDKLKENYNKNFLDCFEVLEKRLVFDEIYPESKYMKNLFNYFKSNKEMILEKSKEINYPKEETFFNNEELYFGKVEKALKEKRDNPDLILDEDISAQAEKLSFAIYGDGWTEKDLNFRSEFYRTDSFEIEMSKVGLFILRKNEEEILRTIKKTEVLEMLVDLGDLEKGSVLYKDVSKKMIPIKTLKNPKHPLVLTEEFNLVKEDVFRGGNVLHKDILKGLKEHYQKNSDMFPDVSIPNFKLDLSVFKRK